MKNRITILHLGIKFWPYNEQVINNLSLKGIRGGGMNKYCDILINSFPENVFTIVICQKLKGQSFIEDIENVRVIRMPAIGSRAIRQIIANIFSFFYALFKFRRLNIDIVHGHMQPGIFFSWILAKLYNSHSVGTPYSFTTIEQNFIYNKICKFIENKYYKKVDALVFESKENQDKAKQLRNLVFENAVVIHTGIEIPLHKSLIKNNDTFNLLYIGRLVKVKALSHLIKGIALLDKKTLSKIKLLIAGEGELYEELNELVKKLNLTEIIKLPGYIENRDKIFLESDIFILPSFQEGLSISLLEAMSFGLACIVNKFGVPFSEEVYEMENNDPETIANTLNILISDIIKVNDLKLKSRRIIEDKFAVNFFANQYLELYNNLIYK